MAHPAEEAGLRARSEQVRFHSEADRLLEALVPRSLRQLEHVRFRAASRHQPADWAALAASRRDANRHAARTAMAVSATMIVEIALISGVTPNFTLP